MTNNTTIELPLQKSTDCFTWILDGIEQNNTPNIDNINDMFSRRHLGGSVYIVILMALGLIGNTAVIWIYSTKFKPSNYRTYTLWLASMDIINCIYGMPFLLIYHFNYLRFPSDIYCKSGRFCLVFTSTASAFLLMVIAFDRYRHICRPLQWQLSRTNIQICCITVVILAVGLSWPNFLLFGYYTVEHLPVNINGTRCWQDDIYRSQDYLGVFYIALSILSFCVSLVLLAAYVEISRHLYNHNRKWKAKNMKKKSSQKGKTTYTLLVVTTAFVLSALPHHIMLVILLLRRDFNCHFTYHEGFYYYLFVWSILINNSINPFIYGFSDSRFKAQVKSIILNCLTTKKSPTNTPNRNPLSVYYVNSSREGSRVSD